VLKTTNEITVLTSDGQIVIEQDHVEGRIATAHEIVLDAFQVPLLCAWLKEAAMEIEG